MSMQHTTIAIIGAGAAGTLAGSFAARHFAAMRQQAEILVLETRRQPGAKIRVSGGGRCNILPSRAELKDFESRGSNNVIKNLLSDWPLEQVRQFFESELGLPLKDEPSGKVFPASDSSKDVVEALLGDLEAQQVTLRTGCEVSEIAVPTSETTPFYLTLRSGEQLSADYLIAAVGGLSMPKTGSDGHILKLLRNMGHRIEVLAPALVPLLTEARWQQELSGLSLDCRLTASRHHKVVGSYRGSLLFTHRGLSGPVVLDISRHLTLDRALGHDGDVVLSATWGSAAEAPCARTFWKQLLHASPKTTLTNLLQRHLPRRLAHALLGCAGLGDAGDRPILQLSKEQRRALLAVLVDMPLETVGSEGFRTAECTTGGVALSDVAWQTLESRRVPRLFICGEALDVTGRLGGFNFLWAWVTGRKAGRAAAAMASVDIRHVA